MLTIGFIEFLIMILFSRCEFTVFYNIKQFIERKPTVFLLLYTNLSHPFLQVGHKNERPTSNDSASFTKNMFYIKTEYMTKRSIKFQATKAARVMLKRSSPPIYIVTLSYDYACACEDKEYHTP